MVSPFNSLGEGNLRTAQRVKQAWELPYRFVETSLGLDPFRARFADTEGKLAFEVHCETGLGLILGFERTPQGYLMLFSSGYEQIRAVWINSVGEILKDVSVPNGLYTEMSFDGRTAVGADGSLYVLSSSERGIDVNLINAP